MGWGRRLHFLLAAGFLGLILGALLWLRFGASLVDDEDFVLYRSVPELLTLTVLAAAIACTLLRDWVLKADRRESWAVALFLPLVVCSVLGGLSWLMSYVHPVAEAMGNGEPTTVLEQLQIFLYGAIFYVVAAAWYIALLHLPVTLLVGWVGIRLLRRSVQGRRKAAI